MGPSGDSELVILEVDRRAAREQVEASARWAIPAAILVVTVLDLTAALVVARLTSGLEGLRMALAVAFTAIGLTIPPLVVMAASAKRSGYERLLQTVAQERMMRGEAGRREFETRLANALEMADTEAEAMHAVDRALVRVDAESAVEILLADNSHAHLEQVLSRGPDGTGPGCGVESPDRCVAARRGQTQVFPDSEALDACPKLLDRRMGRCAAVCVPVSIMGRSVGVVHLARPVAQRLDGSVVAELQVVANQIGARLGMIRVMAETQLQAGTDSLTGLCNRRSFENRVRALRRSGMPFALATIDLDHFKELNDTFGHGAGDRALRVFAAVLRSALRSTDIACRYGGEEFVVVLPDTSTDETVAACERIREELALALRDGDVPPFTASFGVATCSDEETPLEEVLARADSALYRAKDSGRNRTVVHGWELAPSRAPAAG